MTEIKCEAFGDESTSAGDRYAIYSIVGFSPKGVEVATSMLSNIKQHFGVPNSARLHCRVLFSGNQRAKTEWAALNPKHTAEVCRNLSMELLRLEPMWCYGHFDLSTLSSLPRPNLMSGKFSGDAGREFSMGFGMKQAQKYAYSAAELHFVQRFGDGVRFWIDKDDTKIDWFDGRKKAHNIHHGFGAPGQISLPPAYAPMLEIADLFAYTASRHLSQSQQFGQQVFRMIHEKFRPITSKFTFDPSLFGSETSTKDWLRAHQKEDGLPAITTAMALPDPPSEL